MAFTVIALFILFYSVENVDKLSTSNVDNLWRSINAWNASLSLFYSVENVDKLSTFDVDNFYWPTMALCSQA